VVVNRYIASYREQPGQWPVTQSAVETDHITPFAEALDTLEQALRPRLEADWPRVQTAQIRSVRFQMEMVDLRTFCRNLAAAPVHADVKAAANRVTDALKPGGYVIAEGHLGPPVEGCGGVSVYLPAPTDSISKYYQDLRFAKLHRWDQFLQSYQRAAGGG